MATENPTTEIDLAVYGHVVSSVTEVYARLAEAHRGAQTVDPNGNCLVTEVFLDKRGRIGNPTYKVLWPVHLVAPGLACIEGCTKEADVIPRTDCTNAIGETIQIRENGNHPRTVIRLKGETKLLHLEDGLLEQIKA